jgi:hypothetical protein
MQVNQEEIRVTSDEAKAIASHLRRVDSMFCNAVAEKIEAILGDIQSGAANNGYVSIEVHDY